MHSATVCLSSRLRSCCDTVSLLKCIIYELCLQLSMFVCLCARSPVFESMSSVSGINIWYKRIMKWKEMKNRVGGQRRGTKAKPDKCLWVPVHVTCNIQQHCQHFLSSITLAQMFFVTSLATPDVTNFCASEFKPYLPELVRYTSLILSFFALSRLQKCRGSMPRK